MRDRPAPHSFDRLIRAGIAPRRAHRILREFAEHHADVVAEGMTSGDSASEAEAAANDRLGSEQALVVSLLGRHELRSWAHRRPSIAFAIAPVLSFALACVASLLALIALVEWRKVHGDALNAASAVIQGISAYASLYLPGLLPFGFTALLPVIPPPHPPTALCTFASISPFSYTRPSTTSPV